MDRALLEQYRQANAEVAARAKTAVQQIVGNLDLTNPEASRDALLRAMPALTERFGAVAASLAADWYEESRLASGATGRFRARAAATVPAEAVVAQTRFLAGHLWTPQPRNVLGGLLTSVDKYVKQPARDTMASNARREGVRWARVPSGAKTCAFCLVLASRDAVYVSKQSAGGSGGSSYHGDCKCQAVRIGRNEDYPPGYLPDDALEKYEAARAQADSGSIEDVVASMRRNFPDAVNDGVIPK